MIEQRLRQPVLDVLSRLSEDKEHLAVNTYTILRNGYERPFTYSAAIDFEVYDP